MQNGQRLLRPNVLGAARGRFRRALSDAFDFSVERPRFAPKRALVLTKMTRLEYERALHPHLPEDRLQKYLERKGSDYENLLERHKVHHANVAELVSELKSRSIEYHVVPRKLYTSAAIDWADAIISAGGDGTFLLAASRIKRCDKPVVGVNTDPGKSEGHLCLPATRCPSATLRRLLSGRFRWLRRQRIRVSVCGGVDEIGRLQSMRLKYPEYRYSEHFKEVEQAYVIGGDVGGVPADELTVQYTTLPIFALNEVFIGESLSARVSYYEIACGHGDVMRKQKSSGVTVCTGTGSTSWYFHINHLSLRQVEEILHYANERQPTSCRRHYEPSEVADIARQYNSALKFGPEVPLMAWAVRDPVVNSVFAAEVSRGATDLVRIRSRMWDAKLVIDGDYAFSFNDGSLANLEILPEDSLCCVTLPHTAAGHVV